MGDMVLETVGQEAEAFLEIKDGNALVIRQLPGSWGVGGGNLGSLAHPAVLRGLASGHFSWTLRVDPQSH